MLDSIRIESQMISLEAFAPSQGLKAVVSRLPGLVSNVTEFIGKQFADKATEFKMVNGAKSVEALKKVTFADVRGLTIYKAPGQTVSYNELLTVLEDIQSGVIDRMVTEALIPFDTWLAVQLTNPEQLSSVRNARHIPGFIQHDIDSYAKRLGACFDTKDVSSTAEFGKLVERLTDWAPIVKRTNALTEKAMSVPRKDIVTITERITENMNTLVTRIKSSDSGYELSGATMASLATLCYNLAREIEFYSVFMYKVQLHCQAIEDSSNVILGK